MEKLTSRRSVVEKSLRGLSFIVLTGSLAVAGCSRGEGNEATPSSLRSAPSSTSARPNGLPMIVFDDLHGGSPYIQVYPGVTDTAADKQPNGVYNDGDTAQAECKTEGRAVHSDPSVGEEDRTSNDWVKLQGSPAQYATAVYIENPAALLNELPDC